MKRLSVPILMSVLIVIFAAVTPVQTRQAAGKKYSQLRKKGQKASLKSLKGIFVDVNYNGPGEGDYLLTAVPMKIADPVGEFSADYKKENI